MISWEREKMNWIDFQDKSSDEFIYVSDYLTTDDVYRIPLTSSEYFLIENRQKISSYDRAGDSGIYIYHVTNASYNLPKIDVECADGNWDFNFNTSSNVITRETENPSGKDEMSYQIYYGGDSYACFIPHYYESSAWGDNEDAFDDIFNNVFSPASNPRTTNSSSLDFAIEVHQKIGSQYQLELFFDDATDDEFAGKPSKPQNLGATLNSNISSLTWTANIEPDLAHYEIWKKNNPSGSWALLTTTTSNLYTDNVYQISDGEVEYKILAVDNTSKKSMFSISDTITPPSAPQNLSITESANEYALLSWTANTEPDLKEYNIYRKGGYPFVDWAFIGDTVSNTYEDTEVTTTYRHGEDFFYKVTAVDDNDNESGYSNTVEIEARLEKQIVKENLELKPKEYALDSNYPNPFNPTTQISYQTPKNGFVNLVVYNALGQEVEVLVNQHQSSGKYSVQFNASSLPSGVYIYKLNAGEFSSVKKMLLTK